MKKNMIKIVSFMIILYSLQITSLESASYERAYDNSSENSNRIIYQSKDSLKDISLNEGEKIVSGNKTVYYKNGKGVLLWSITVEGTFKYGNGSATCIDSNIIIDCKDSNWNISNYYITKTDNSAIASAVGKRYLFGIPMQTINKVVDLKCSNDGLLQ